MKKLLFVDDNLTYRQLIKYWLSHTNYLFQIVKNAEEALIKLETEKFDVIITDLFMPDISGLMLTEIVKEKYHIPILIITANSAFELSSYNFENKYPKPCTKIHFLEFLKKYVD